MTIIEILTKIMDPIDLGFIFFFSCGGPPLWTQDGTMDSCSAQLVDQGPQGPPAPRAESNLFHVMALDIDDREGLCALLKN